MNFPTIGLQQPYNPVTSPGDPIGNDQSPVEQDYRRRMMMAQSLMGQKANPNTPYAGLANVGSSLAGAYIGHMAQPQAQTVTTPAQLQAGQPVTEALREQVPLSGNQAQLYQPQTQTVQTPAQAVPNRMFGPLFTPNNNLPSQQSGNVPSQRGRGLFGFGGGPF